ncbi:M56 family metallopeptidase, partial [Paenibacillus azoreducens]|uniref:M56 family metallopeptidase n=1 Tax=Paenibacillus azoreducens TaxID=116718 RepID=UPI0039F49A31
MGHFFELLVTLTIAGSTVVSCILLLRLFSPTIFPAKWRYVIGKMAVWLYLLPVAFVLKKLMELFTSKPVLTALTPGTASAPVQEVSTERIADWVSGQSISAETAWVMLSLWGVGALSFLSWQVYCYYRFIKKIQSTNVPVPKDGEEAKQLASRKQALGINGTVQLAFNSNVRSPVLVGLLKPTILIPMSSNVDMDLGMVIQHELIHLRRKDLWVKMLVVWISALHWFNPFVHLLRKDIHTWSEFSCDEEVVKEMSYAERKRYGETILNVMIGSRGLPVSFCSTLSGDGKQLKRRLMMMLNVKKPKKKTLYLTVTAVFLVAVASTSAAVWASGNVPPVAESKTNDAATAPHEE